MIDLGDELADYGEQPQTPSKPPDGMGSFGRLADLQAGGFDVDPRRADANPRQWGFNQGLSSLTISVEPLVNDTWAMRVAKGAAGVAIGGGGGGKAAWITPGGAGGGFESTGSISGDNDSEW